MAAPLIPTDEQIRIMLLNIPNVDERRQRGHDWVVIQKLKELLWMRLRTEPNPKEPINPIYLVMEAPPWAAWHLSVSEGATQDSEYIERYADVIDAITGGMIVMGPNIIDQLLLHPLTKAGEQNLATLGELTIILTRIKE